MFIASMILTSVIGYFICYGFRRHMGLTEKIFISIFVGWYYFTCLYFSFSYIFRTVKLNEKILFLLAISSFIVAFGLLIAIKKDSLAALFRALPAIKARSRFTNIRYLILRGYLIVPSLFLILIVLSVGVDALFYTRVSAVDPIFQWDQRGELIYLGKAVMAQKQHPFSGYPLHIPLLHAWAYFFHFDNPRIFYFIAFLGMIAILMRHIRDYSKSTYCALVFTIAIAVTQVPYVLENHSEGIANIYLILSVMYALKYIKARNIIFMAPCLIFLAMYCTVRSEGVLFAVVLLFSVVAIGWRNESFRAACNAFSSVLKKIFTIRYILCFFLTLFVFCFVYGDYILSQAPKVVMYIKMILKFVLDMLSNWGNLYKNQKLLSSYQSNDFFCMGMSIFTFLESLFCSVQKTYAYNLLISFLSVCKQIGLSMGLLFILILLFESNKRKMAKRFLVSVMSIFLTYIILMAFMQIKFYWWDQTMMEHVMSAPRYSCRVVICFILFLSTNDFIKRAFVTIESRKFLAYALNVPFLYFLLKHVWSLVLIY